MKHSKLCILAAALIVPSFGMGIVNAQDLLRAELNTRSVRTNDTGGLSYTPYGNHQVIAAAAAAAGVTNLSGLRLVYNRTNDDLEVVMGTNNTVIATPLTFSGGVSVSKTNGTVSERLSWIFLGTNTVAAGTLAATETSHFGTSNELTHFSLIGQVQFADSASGTNGDAIYVGNLVVEPFIRPLPIHGHGWGR